MSDDGVPTAATTLGRNARLLRGELKTEAVAAAVRAAGLKSWNTGRVAHLESGRVSPTVTTLYALTRAFSFLRPDGDPVTIADLFDGDGSVELGDGTAVELSALRAALSGNPPEPLTGAEMVASATQDLEAEVRSWSAANQRRWKQLRGGPHMDTTRTFTEADARVANSLGISRSRAILEMAGLWGQALSAQRDQEAGPDATQQKRGRISRKLKQELREAIDAHGDD